MFLTIPRYGYLVKQMPSPRITFCHKYALVQQPCTYLRLDNMKSTWGFVLFLLYNCVCVYSFITQGSSGGNTVSNTLTLVDTVRKLVEQEIGQLKGDVERELVLLQGRVVKLESENNDLHSRIDNLEARNMELETKIEVT